ncbi:filamentous hemagglutinin N-terminal domain-containing protein [Pseudanabaena sp. PCC 6802]|uniref:two-partner secretion domain-containing protein n=1 Tax=Pseudanabaena sp. PCC 6802 TaxID=118173 RepID=UPI00138ABEA0|nr:filamentous hemagglutinin N-terminal domain-containing protein [Pseudanabaena sp. PCC 6802]
MGRMHAESLGIVLAIALLPSPAVAQIIPDRTLRQNSVVTPNGNLITVTGGSEVGKNLFHSFQQFSLNAGNTAFFNNSTNVENIITRITGSSISNIDGLIRANGSANLFLINPNGIVFGPNASLNIGGSFFASTAEAIAFNNGDRFSAVNPQPAPLLTVSAPVGLVFGSNPGNIVNRSQTTIPTTNPDPTAPPFVKVGLQVQPQKTIGLIGGDILIDNGSITAPQGRIELGSVKGKGTASILPDDSGFSLGYTNIPNFGNIELSNLAKLNTSGLTGGAISLQSHNLNITSGSRIESTTFGEGTGKPIFVNAANSVNISQGDLFVVEGESVLSPPTRLSGIITNTVGTGKGGDIRVLTSKLLLKDGGRLGIATAGSGQSGNLFVKASDSIEITGVANLTGGTPVVPPFLSLGAAARLPANFFAEIFTLSGILLQGLSTGSSGQIVVETNNLTIKDGGLVSASVFIGSGRGGNVDVRVAESTNISGISPRLASPSGIFTTSFGVGSAGDLSLQTKQLRVRDGGAVAASSATVGDAGNLRVTATDIIELSGRVGNFPSGIFAQSVGVGNAGNLRISADRLIVKDRAVITVAAEATGSAGNLEILARTLRVENGGEITAASRTTTGGNIRFEVGDLVLRNSSVVSATAANLGNGGNLDINADTIALLDRSRITASAFQGQGGNIQIDTQGLFRTANSSISATSQLGINGVVEIRTPEIDLQNSLAPIAISFTDPNSLITNSCLARRNAERGSFVITGQGGLPRSPYDDKVASQYQVSELQGQDATSNSANSNIDRDRVESERDRSASPTTTKPAYPIQEAQGLVVANGRVLLATSMPQNSPNIEGLICY